MHGPSERQRNCMESRRWVLTKMEMEEEDDWETLGLEGALGS